MRAEWSGIRSAKAHDERAILIEWSRGGGRAMRAGSAGQQATDKGSPGASVSWVIPSQHFEGRMPYESPGCRLPYGVVA